MNSSIGERSKMNFLINVIKRDGSKEPLDIEKWQSQIAKICDGISNVSQSMIEIKCQPHFYDGMTTREIDEITLRAIVDLIDVDSNPEIGHINYQYVAGKQRLSMLRKDVYGSYNPSRLYSIVKKNIDLGLYTSELLDWYTESEFDQMEQFIDHSKDEEYPYSAIEQLIEKYLVKNRFTKKVFETPQIRYMIAAATVMHKENINQRMKLIKEYYTSSSDGLFTLSTPVLSGLGTPTKQFSSCVLIKSDDSLDSIFASGEMMAKYASKRAGIGLEIGRLRPLGSPIRGGELVHTGLIPFIKKWFGDLRSCCVTPETWVEIFDPNENTQKKIQIKDLSIGSLIKTMNSDRSIVFKTVLDKFPTKVLRKDQIKISFENQSRIDCSVNHPIMVLSENKIVSKFPDCLSKKDVVITDSGFTHLDNIEFMQNNDPNYIDITVEDCHTFFASSELNDPMILTHNSQGGIRNASCTVFFPIWHYQFEELIVLKNNQGTEETRVRHLDYGVVLSSYFWNRFKKKEDITFFDPNEVPDLYETFYKNTEEFNRLYEYYEENSEKLNLRVKKISAEEIFKNGIIRERTNTGRIYLVYIDNIQNQGSFDTKITPIYQSNLCCLTGDSELDVIMDNQKSKVTLKDLVDLFDQSKEINVLSYNILSGEREYKRVKSALLTRKNARLMKIEDSESGKSIICTPDHRVFTQNRGYIEAQFLKEDDALVFNMVKDSKSLLKASYLENQEDVYDIEVEDYHNFFANDILVHNCEITLPTIPFNRLEDEDGRISLCTLGSINWGAFRNPDDMRRACRILHRSLNNILDYQDFLSVQSKKSNDDIRPLGIGVTNLAYWHAKRKLKYGEKNSLDEVKSWIEHQAYYLTEASVELAKERGKCNLSDTTCYGQGIFPWEKRSKGVDELTDFTPELNWEPLREEMIKYGVRNATISAVAPVESCHSWEDKINTTDGKFPNFHELCELAGLDWRQIESENLIGHHRIQEISVVGPDGKEDFITDIYYNGLSHVNELEFEDGSIVKLTDNHRLLVYRDGEKKWLHVWELEEGDDVVEIDDFGETEIPT